VEPTLTRQDAQPFRPHVTLQNKVPPEVARATLADLGATWEDVEAEARGLDVWAYDGGPWQHLSGMPFESAAG
jgi:hypothetical protein